MASHVFNIMYDMAAGDIFQVQNDMINDDPAAIKRSVSINILFS